MSREDAINPEDRTSVAETAAPIYGVVLGVGVVCSLAIVSVYELTRPIIERNRLALRDRAIANVLDETTTIIPFRYDRSAGRFESVESVDQKDATDSGELVFAGYTDQRRWVGVALECSGMGYQDRIETVYGYEPETQSIVGVEVLQSRETPGLGDRIETDPEFQKNFDQLDVSVDDATGELEHPIEFVKPGQKNEPWQIDGITGATISSRAIANMLSESAARWVPLIQQRREDFELGPTARQR